LEGEKAQGFAVLAELGMGHDQFRTLLEEGAIESYPPVHYGSLIEQGFQLFEPVLNGLEVEKRRTLQEQYCLESDSLARRVVGGFSDILAVREVGPRLEILVDCSST
jgi:hypothetical protein